MLTQEAQGQFATFISLGRQNRMKGWVMPPCFVTSNKKATYYCILVTVSLSGARRMSKWLYGVDRYDNWDGLYQGLLILVKPFFFMGAFAAPVGLTDTPLVTEVRARGQIHVQRPI